MIRESKAIQISRKSRRRKRRSRRF